MKNSVFLRFIREMPEEARVAAIVTLTKMSTNEEDYTVLWSSANLVEVLTELSKDKYWKVRREVAENPATPAKILEQLSEDEDEVRSAVAGNPRTPPAVLTELSKDKYWKVRFEVAVNPATPAEVLTKLSKDKDEKVRCNVAVNSCYAKFKFSKRINNF